jgi:hypothetical protein
MAPTKLSSTTTSCKTKVQVTKQSVIKQPKGHKAKSITIVNDKSRTWQSILAYKVFIDLLTSQQHL